MYFLYNNSVRSDYSKCTYLAWTHEQQVNHTHTDMRGSIAHGAGIQQVKSGNHKCTNNDKIFLEVKTQS